MKEQWGVLSEDGTIYGVGVWRNGVYHPGTRWRAWRELRKLRRTEPHARLAKKPIVWKDDMVAQRRFMKRLLWDGFLTFLVVVIIVLSSIDAWQGHYARASYGVGLAILVSMPRKR